MLASRDVRATTTRRSGPSVQVGDPFAEKLLIEASLELIERGLVEGLQDLGAAGITCATSETADRAGTGIVVDLDAVPRREPGMAPFEVMISESQERMLAIVAAGALARPSRGLRALGPALRGHRPGHRRRRHHRDGGSTPTAGELARGSPGPGRALTSDAIVHRPARRPAGASARGARRRARPIVASDQLPERGMDPGAVLLALLGSPNFASRRAVFEQYDCTVQAIDGGRSGPAAPRSFASRARRRPSLRRRTATPA